MFEFVNQVFHLLALGVICITLKMSPSVSQVRNRVHFPSLPTVRSSHVTKLDQCILRKRALCHSEAKYYYWYDTL